MPVPHVAVRTVGVDGVEYVVDVAVVDADNEADFGVVREHLPNLVHSGDIDGGRVGFVLLNATLGECGAVDPLPWEMMDEAHGWLLRRSAGVDRAVPSVLNSIGAPPSPGGSTPSPVARLLLYAPYSARWCCRLVSPVRGCRIGGSFGRFPPRGPK